MHNRKWCLSGLGVVVLLVASGCQNGDVDSYEGADVAEADRFGGIVVVGSYGDLQSMNGLTSTDSHSNSVQRDMLFMPLVRYDENIEPVPWLAERWDVVQAPGDSIDLTFHVRRDVRWHDGPTTTAEDVLFTFERAVDPRTAFPNSSSFDQYSRVAELIDPYTIRFRLRPHSDYMDAWYQTPIMPRHVLGDVPPEQLLQHPFSHQPVGNGPFRFVRYAAGQEWVFEANPDFPAALGGRPYVDRIVYRNIPEMTTLLTELLTGRVDIYLGPNPNQAEQIERAPNTRLIASPNRQWNYLAFNTRRPLFQDARVRRAIAMGLNREQIIEALVFGYGDVGRSTVTPAHWSYDPNDPETLLPYDPDGARALLAEAGWRPGPDGILRNAQGQEFRFTLITNAGNDVRRDMLEITQAQLRPLGIIVQPRLLEWTTLISTVQDPRRNFDAVVSGWVDFFRKDDADILHSRNMDRPYQYVGFSHPRADELIDTLAVLTDREIARPLWREYQRLIVHEAPYIPLYYPLRLTGVSTRLQGAEMDIRGEFTNAARWWIAPADRRGIPSAAEARP